MKNAEFFALIQECFFLPDDTGVPFWKVRPIEHFGSDRYMRTVNTRNANKPAGNTSREDGRRKVVLTFKSERFSVYGYQIVWALTHGSWPTSEIDHKDRDPTNDQPRNLRLATHQQNIGNIDISSHNTSGQKGVSWRPDRQRWRATIKVNGKSKHLGNFQAKQDAAKAYAAAASAHFGADFAYVGEA